MNRCAQHSGATAPPFSDNLKKKMEGGSQQPSLSPMRAKVIDSEAVNSIYELKNLCNKICIIAMYQTCGNNKTWSLCTHSDEILLYVCRRCNIVMNAASCGLHQVCACFGVRVVHFVFVSVCVFLCKYFLCYLQPARTRSVIATPIVDYS